MYKFLTDQNKMKEMRDRLKELREKSKVAQKEDPEKAKEYTNEMLKMSNQQMKMNMKPMVVSLFYVIFILSWMATTFPGPIIDVPFNWHFSGTENFGWLIWYFVVSIPCNTIYRKIFGIM